MLISPFLSRHSVQELRLAMIQHRSLIKERERIMELRAVADAEA